MATNFICSQTGPVTRSLRARRPRPSRGSSGLRPETRTRIESKQNKPNQPARIAPITDENQAEPKRR